MFASVAIITICAICWKEMNFTRFNGCCYIQSALGGQLATTLVDRYFHHYFFLARAAALQSIVVRRSTGNDISGHYIHHFCCCFVSSIFFSVEPFSHRRSAPIKKHILKKLLGAPNNLGIDPFLDPIGHLGPPWRPF